jgi:hypothetical protein
MFGRASAEERVIAGPDYSGPEDPGAANQAAIFTRRAPAAGAAAATAATSLLPHGMSSFWGPARVAVLPELSAPAPEPVLGIKRLLSEGAVSVACRRPSKMTVLLDDSDVEEL